MKKIKFILILIFITSLGIESCQHPQSQQKAFFDDKVILESNSCVAAYAIPNIVATPKGTVLCFATARIGDNHDWGNVQEVVVSRSTDNGETWESPKVIAAINDWTVRQSSAIVDPESGKIMVFGHKSPRFTAEGERISETWKIAHPDEMKKLGDGHFYVESFDDGASWSEIKSIELPYWPHDPGIVLRYGKHKGHYILPARTITGEKMDWNNMFNGVLFSDDKGKTWQAGGLTQSQVGEACVVELSDGRVYVNSRNHADNYGIRNHAISSDGGVTFTEFGNDPQLIEPTCDAGIVSFESPEKGHVILFSNPAVKATKRWDGASRRRMSVKASFDDAKNWPLNKLVFEGPSAYSGITVGKDGMIFLVYERAGPGKKDSRQNLAIARFNLAWLQQEEVAPPIIEDQNSVFYKKQEVKISAAKNAHIYYTLDGSKPDKTSLLYIQPLTLEESTIIKAVSILDNNESIVSNSRFIKSKFQAPVYITTYNEDYPASGELALVDGIKGSNNYHDGCWQGFEGDNLELVIDLSSVIEVNSVSVGFLQATDFWIFYPEFVSFEISVDGKEFTKTTTIQNEIPLMETGPAKQIFKAGFLEMKVRYIKIIAKNIGLCPNWHKGAGGKAWLFADEIIIN